MLIFRAWATCAVLKPKWAWSWQGNTTANEIAMALSRCRSAIGHIRLSVLVVTISVMRRRKIEKELV